MRSAADQPAKPKKGAPTKQSKIIFSETLTIAEFEAGSEIGGQSEYAFKMTLPNTVTESIMVQFSQHHFLSVIYYLRA